MEFLRLHMLRKPIDVLVGQSLALPNDTAVLTFTSCDAAPVAEVLRACGLPWAVEYCRPRVRCQTHARSREAERAFLQRCLSDPQWRGGGEGQEPAD